MPYNNLTDRTDAGPLIPEEVAAEIIQSAAKDSAALTMFRQVRMARGQQRLPVLNVLPIAYFVNGDTGLKQTSEVGWTNKYLNAEEVAVILPVPEAVADDMQFDIWDSAQPLLTEAVGRTIDAAVFFGVNKPASWPTDIVAAAVAAGNAVDRGTNAAAAGGITGDIDDVIGTVEADGYEVNGFVAHSSMRGRLRDARDTTGQRFGDRLNEYEGQPIAYPMRGLWPLPVGAAAPYSQVASLIAGDFTQGILGVRQDLTIKRLDQAVIQDNTGAIVYNLAQQDMVALRLTMRVAFQVANPINYDQGTEASRYPFGVLRNPTSSNAI